MPALGRMFQELKKKGRQRVTDLNSSVSLEFSVVASHSSLFFKIKKGTECVLNAGCSENYDKERNREFLDLNSSVSEGFEK